MNFNANTRTLDLLSTLRNDIGNYTVEVRVDLEKYIESGVVVPHVMRFNVAIVQCIPETMTPTLELKN